MKTMNESLAKKILELKQNDYAVLRYDELKEIQEILAIQPEFKGFGKIPRLNREIIITEKIDGTNAQVLVTPDGRIFPGSRKRWLTVEHDNYGFCAWVQEYEEELLQLGPGRHFGEWWGQGIQRGYGLDHKRFSLFDVGRWVDRNREIGIDYWLDTSDKRQRAPACCHVVPVLRVDSEFSSIFIYAALASLESRGSLAVPGFMNPEGIVIFHMASGQPFKVTLENDEKPKGKKDA